LLPGNVISLSSFYVENTYLLSAENQDDCFLQISISDILIPAGMKKLKEKKSRIVLRLKSVDMSFVKTDCLYKFGYVVPGNSLNYPDAPFTGKGYFHLK
jgi:hypothetical protein